jgi:predicted butyrate kinase (DUF1464 family)
MERTLGCLDAFRPLVIPLPTVPAGKKRKQISSRRAEMNSVCEKRLSIMKHRREEAMEQTSLSSGGAGKRPLLILPFVSTQ